MEIKSKQGNFRLREWMLTDGVSLAKHINNVKIWNNVRDGLPYPYTILDAVSYTHLLANQKSNPESKTINSYCAESFIAQRPFLFWATSF